MTSDVHIHTNALTDMHLQTWEQHGRNYFSILQHVNDAALEIFTAVGLQVAIETTRSKIWVKREETV